MLSFSMYNIKGLGNVSVDIYLNYLFKFFEDSFDNNIVFQNSSSTEWVKTSVRFVIVIFTPNTFIHLKQATGHHFTQYFLARLKVGNLCVQKLVGGQSLRRRHILINLTFLWLAYEKVALPFLLSSLCFGTHLLSEKLSFVRYHSSIFQQVFPGLALKIIDNR